MSETEYRFSAELVGRILGVLSEHSTYTQGDDDDRDDFNDEEVLALMEEIKTIAMAQQPSALLQWPYVPAAAPRTL